MKDQLLKGSTDASGRALQHYVAGEYDQFLVHAAHAFELLCKARLAAIHPSLIIDKDFDSLLHVCAAGKHSKRKPWNIKTITASDALTRCTQIVPPLGDFRDELKLLAEYRNSAVHLGTIVEDEQKKIVGAYIAGTSIITDEMGIARPDFFGEYAELVAKHLDKSLEDVSRTVEEKLVHAKAVFEQRFESLEKEQMEVVAKAIEASYSVSKYERILQECPACGYMGLISGDYDVEWQVDVDEDGYHSSYPTVTMRAGDFVCSFCQLMLDGSAELKAAKLPTDIEIEDPDPNDFAPEPDYEYG
jgi:hypothetical protein